MKKIVMAIIVVALSYTATVAETKFQFGVKPGFGNLNSGYFGADFGKLSLLGGVQAGMINVTETRTTSYTYSDDSMEDRTNTRDHKQSLQLYNVFVGTNIDLFRVNDVQTYLSAVVSKPIALVKEERIDSNEEDYSSDDELGDLSIWGGQLGFGSQYYFTENFSLGGEFGLQYYIFSNETSSDFDNGNLVEKYSREFNMGAGLTYSTLVLNFYF